MGLRSLFFPTRDEKRARLEKQIARLKESEHKKNGGGHGGLEAGYRGRERGKFGVY